MNLKKKIGVLMLVIGIGASSMAQEKEKPASPAESTTGKINGTTITINYSSPSVKGRAIWGGLVPFGQVWRAGANNATTFITDKEVTIENAKLPAGKYTFFVIPEKTECTIIFNKVKEQWGAYDYKQSEDQLRVKVKPVATDKSAEKLVYTIGKDNVTLSWEKWNIPIKVK